MDFSRVSRPALIGNRYNSFLSAHSFVALVVVITIYRWIVLYTGSLNLHFDEAQYWLWAQNPAWGYFSKPPMIAWMIAAYQFFFGDSVVALKSLSLFTYLLTSGVVYSLACRVHNHQVARYSVLLLLTMPAVSISSLAITTDVFLIFFWSVALWLLVQSDNSSGGVRFGYLALLGVTIGLGLLTKYTMVLFLLSMVLWYLRLPTTQWPRLFIDGVFVAVIALVVMSPNLWWNVTHQMASFKHLHEISQVSSSRFHVGELLSFWGAQVGVVGLFSALLFVRYCLCSLPRALSNQSTYRWFCFFIAFFMIISLQALVSRAFANWAAPCYIAAIIWLSHTLCAHGRKHLLIISIVVNLLTMVVVYHYEALYKQVGIPISKRTDLMRATRGWPELGRFVTNIMELNDEAILLVDERKVLVELIYYAGPKARDGQIFNGNRVMKNHFHLTQDLDQLTGRSFIWVTRANNIAPYQDYFHSIDKLLCYEPSPHDRFCAYKFEYFTGYYYNERQPLYCNTTSRCCYYFDGKGPLSKCFMDNMCKNRGWD
tara:strand:+ start:387 stop:2009 length:1623 start_codon:yes stop_codon:yes gene_type:complete